MTGRMLLLAAAALAAAAPSAAARPAKPAVVGGTPVAIESAPWQVFVRASNPPLACGGAILDATRILTAAHCVVATGASAPRPPADIAVLAGANDVAAFAGGAPPPPGAQARAAAAVRVHPNYAEQPQHIDDVAIVTLAQPLNLSTPRTQPIALAPAPPAPGAALSLVGYGQIDSARPPDGRLYGATLSAIGDDDCRDVLNGTSPVVQCAHSPTAAACFGDSGSALVAGGAVVGVASFLRAPCGSAPSGFADVTAPEVRAFVDGAAQIPIAPRQTAGATLRWAQPPVNGSPLRCRPGSWSGSPQLSYTFRIDGGEVLQSGGANAYAPRRAAVGKRIVCVVSAANGGGVATARSGTSPAIRRDRVGPRVAVRSARCSGGRCRVALQAADPNSWGALRIRVVARAGRSARALRVRKVGRIAYRAVGRAPRGGAPRIAVRVTDAAGNRKRARGVRAR